MSSYATRPPALAPQARPDPSPGPPDGACRTMRDDGSNAGFLPCGRAGTGGTPRLGPPITRRRFIMRDRGEASMATTTTQELRPGARYRIQSIERAVSILNAFSAETPELGVTELAERLALHKSTVHRF